MRFSVDRHWNLLFIFSAFISFGQCQDSVWFPSNSNNFTYCNQGQFNVSSVNRYFDVSTSTFKLNFTSTSNMTVTNLNQQGSTSSASMMELSFGFQTIQAPAQQFCLDSVKGCPIPENQPFTIEKSLNLSKIPLYPLADISAQYIAISADSKHLVCLTVAPVGYQHPLWRNIFLWLPIGITFSAAIISLIASFTIFHDSAEHDIFLFSSNYAMLPGVLRLKTPGVFDLIFYAQFIVITGQFNIDYPRFHALFSSNFSWSFLLFDESRWLNGVIKSMFKASSSPIESVASIPGYSIYKRQVANTTATATSTASHSNATVDITGTGMSEFATAAGIDINALFFTTMVYLLLIIGSCLVLCFLTWAVFYLTGKLTSSRQSMIHSKKMWDFTIGVLVRILSLAYLPVLTLSFYQLMVPSFWYITLLAAGFLVTPFLFYGFVSIKLFQIRPASFVFTELKLLLRYGSLYNAFTDDTFHFFIAIVVYKSLVAAMIGLFQQSGLAQIILVLLAEASLMAGLLLKLPYADSHVNLIHIIYGFIRLTVFALNIAYLPSLQATVMSKQYVGYIQLAIHCLAYVLFLVLQIKNVVTIATGLADDELDETGKPPARMVFWKKRKRRPNRLHATSTATLMTMSSQGGGGNRPRSQSASFYMGNNGSNRNSTNRLTIDSQTLDMFTNYYGVAAANSSTTSTAQQHVGVLKPDEVRKAPPAEHRTSSDPKLETTNENMLQYPTLIKEYRSNTKCPQLQPSSSTNHPPIELTKEGGGGASTSAARRNYKLDDDIIPSSEPLMSSINNTLLFNQAPTTKTSRPPPPPLPKHLIFNNESDFSPPHQPSPTSINIQNDV